MKIKLMIDGQEKTFDTGAQTADAIFKAAQFEEELKKETTNLSKLNAMNAHVVEMYGNQFTEADIRNGISAEDYRKVIQYQCFGVGQEIAKKSKNE